MHALFAFLFIGWIINLLEDDEWRVPTLIVIAIVIVAFVTAYYFGRNEINMSYT